MENSIYEFSPDRCFYDGKTLKELATKAEETMDRETEEKYELGLYEREATRNEFFLFHGNDILRFAQKVTCQDCHSTAFLDDSEQYCISADYGTIRPIVQFSDVPDDFDFVGAGLKSAEDADYFHTGNGWEARVKETGKQIICSDFSLSARILGEIESAAKKLFDAQVKPKLTLDAIHASLDIKKSAKVYAFSMRDILVPIQNGFLVRDLNMPDTKLRYGQERAMSCSKCRVKNSTVTGSWPGEVTRMKISDTDSFAEYARGIERNFEKLFDKMVDEKTSNSSVDLSQKIERTLDSIFATIHEIVDELTEKDYVFSSYCEICGEETLFRDVQEVSPSLDEALPFLDSVTSEMLMNGRFGSNAPTMRARRMGVIQTHFDPDAYRQLFGFGSQASKKSDRVEQSEEEKLPKGWKFVRAR
jgi:hypothetical protein